MAHTLSLYTRPGCHLCEQALAVLRQLQPEFGFAIEEVDISRNPDLLQQYGVDIPLILLDGREVARHRIAADSFRDLLRRQIA